MWPGLDAGPVSYNMWVEVVVGSRHPLRVFLLDLWFFSPRNNQLLQILIRPG